MTLVKGFKYEENPLRAKTILTLFNVRVYQWKQSTKNQIKRCINQILFPVCLHLCNKVMAAFTFFIQKHVFIHSSVELYRINVRLTVGDASKLFVMIRKTWRCVVFLQTLNVVNTENKPKRSNRTLNLWFLSDIQNLTGVLLLSWTVTPHQK